MRATRKPDNMPRMFRRYKASPIGAPADGLCASCARAIFRGDTVRITQELQVVHWDCWHRELSWRSTVSDDLLGRPMATEVSGSSGFNGFDHT